MLEQTENRVFRKPIKSNMDYSELNIKINFKKAMDSMLFTDEREQRVLQRFVALQGTGTGVRCHVRRVRATNSNDRQQFPSGFRVLFIFLYLLS